MESRTPFAETQPEPGASASQAPADAHTVWRLAKCEWIFATQERQRALSNTASGLFRFTDLTPDQFLDNFYAPGRPVVLYDVINDWPALQKWTPQYLREPIGEAAIEVQGGRNANARYELDKHAHQRRMPFDQFVDQVAAGSGNDLYLTAYNASNNAAALAPLAADLGAIDAVLDHKPGQSAGMIWIGPAGTFTPLHHDLTNNLLVQITGRKRVVLVSPAYTPQLYNQQHVFSEVGDLTDPNLDLARFPKLNGIRTLDLVLGPGEALFIPIGWWHQVQSLDFSISLTYTNFRWPNEGHQDHPVRV